MKKINIETLIPDKFKFLARDMDGGVFVFENKPNLAIDIACDTWDVKEGTMLQITKPVFLSAEEISYTAINSELGDWRDSLIELNDETILN
jgi:hypothetical protein